MGWLHDLNQEPDQAIEEYYKAAMADPSNDQLILDLSRRLIRLEKYDRAAVLLSKATSVPDASGAVFARLGMVYAMQGKTNDAIHAVQEAIKRMPDSIVGYQTLAQMYLQSGRSAEALRVLDQAAAQPNPGADFLIDLAQLYTAYARGQDPHNEALEKKAAALLDQARVMKTTSLLALLQMAQTYELLGQPAKGAEVYQEILKIDPTLTDARVRLAEIYLRGEKPEAAEEQLKAIVRDHPTHAEAYFLLGGLAYDAKKLPEAVDYFQKTILLKPDFDQAYYNLAAAQINANHPDAALSTLEKARERFKQNFMVEFMSALACSKKEDYPAAINHFVTAEVIARATNTNQLNNRFYFQLGAVYERNKNYEEAEKYFKKSLELSPDYSEALNYLGYMWADRGEHLEEARQMIEKAVKQEPENAAFLDSLGWVLYKLNRPREALDWLLKAVKNVDEPDATLFDHLGDIYRALQQPDKAREAWRKSVAIEPNEMVQHKLSAGPASSDSSSK